MFAVIFDMDGVIVDNGNAHAKAFDVFLQQHGRRLHEEEYLEKIAGRSNREIFPDLFEGITEEQAEAYAAEKERLYREIYEKEGIAPVAGLIELLEELQERGIPMSVATSAPPENVALVLTATKTRPYFNDIVDLPQVKHAKPHPEVYVTAAERLRVPSEKCVVFEDSIPGVEAGKAAGMHVVAITTKHTPEELARADKVIRDFTEVSFAWLHALFDERGGAENS